MRPTTAPPDQLSAGDVMSRAFLEVSADTSIAIAWRLLYSTGSTHLVVCDRGRCAGVVDDRRIALEWPSGVFESRRRAVGRLFEGPPTTVSADTSVRDVARVMATAGVSALAVVDSEMRPLGLITAADLIAVLAGAPATGSVRPGSGELGSADSD